MFDAHPAVPASSAQESTSVDSAADLGGAPDSGVDASPSVSPAAANTPAPQASPSGAQSLIGNAAPKPEEYQPNFKFTVRKKEYEIDPFLRSAIKDAESEKKVKELYEKAYGMDIIRPKYQELISNHDRIRAENEHFQTSVMELRDCYQRGDFDTFFSKLAIPEEKILQWVISKAQYNELPPEQRKVLDEKRAAEQKAYALEKQHTHLQQALEEQAASAKAQALQIALEKPDLKAVVDTFDARAGKQGAFLDAVIDAGELAWLRSNGQVDLTPEQAIQVVLARLGNPSQPVQAPVIPVQGNNPAQAPQTPHAMAAPRKPAAIPNIASRQSSSVAKPKPRSIDDLKKLAAQMSG